MTKITPVDKIEILSVSLLEEQRFRVEGLKRLAQALGIGLGWHYLLDWSWILTHLDKPRGKKILDAGAGQGLLQWLLAEEGAQVLSVDRGSRADLSIRFRARYNVRGLRPEDLSPASQVIRRNIESAESAPAKVLAAARGWGGMMISMLPKAAQGKVFIYNHDLQQMDLVPSDSQDAVVAVSALEHNDPEGLERVVAELMRVLKPGGVLLATLCAARGDDRFHEPSKGWCYTDTSLRRLFDLPENTPSNYARYDQLFTALKNCAELRDNLAPFYSQSGDNGMPWGKWDPQYQPVGVCKVKA